ncbi:MAG: type II toxin-antitoxin system RelE/ParE family toxin [Terriglobus sp.]
MSVSLTDFAQDTLVAAYEFIYNSSPQNAELVLGRVEKILDLLVDTKFIGENGPIPGTRRYLMPKTSLLIVYRVVGQDVQVLAFLHQSQRWPNIPIP